jgi:diketogulonate reductase-like aldo/keto reductase
MRIGVGIFSANKAVAVNREASALAVDNFMKRRRSIEAYSACRASLPDAIGVSQKRPTMEFVTRREAGKMIGTAAAGLMLPTDPSRGQASSESSAMLTRIIPSSGEKLPAIGLGTWKAFDVDLTADIRRQLTDVLSLFVKLGGRLIDSSPMYGRAEEVIGDLTSAPGFREKLFFATKVWTHGKESGIRSMERSMSLLHTKRIDLMQVHNLVDVNTQLATLHEWKQQGRIRYTGITHYESGALSEVEKLMRSQKFDFLQINYSLMEPEAERILPLAQERGVAVIANRPFGSGDLFGKVRSKPLPGWAAEFDCRSWAQFFLKWIVANPAITCAIPATDKPRHLEDNMQGGIGRLPDAKMRRRMREFVSSS